LNKIPRFVRDEVKRNTEKFARRKGILNVTVKVMHAAKEALSQVPDQYQFIYYIECILYKKSGSNSIPIPLISIELMTIHNHVSIMIRDLKNIV
jgi:hypothetical protein